MKPLAILEQVVTRCRDEDMRRAAVYQALDALQTRSAETWPFDQFRKSLDMDRPDDRYQNVNASFNAIRLHLKP